MSKTQYNFVMDTPEIETIISPLMMKIKLRSENIGHRPITSVIDAYHGNGEVWRGVKKTLIKNFNVHVLGLTNKTTSKKSISLQGNVIKHIKSLDLSGFDIIDIDAPGSPYNALKAVLRNKSIKKARVFFTLNQIMGHGLDNKMLHDLGFSQSMVKKARPMLKPRAFELFKGWLGRNGIKKLNYYGLKYAWGHCYFGFFDIKR